MKKINLLITSVLSVLALTTAHAESLQTKIHHQYQSPRALGMGDAFVAVADDYSAFYYNPAALAWRSNGQVNMSMDFSFSSSFLDFFKDADTAGKTQGTESDKITAYTKFLQSYYGKNFSGRFGLFEGVWARPNWAVAVIPADISLDFQVLNQATPALDVKAYVDTTVSYSYATDLDEVTDDLLAMGATFKFVNRGYFAKTLNTIDLAASSSNGSQIVKKTDLTEGYTLDMDLGFIYTPVFADESSWAWMDVFDPTFGLVVRNVFDYGFGSSMKLLNKEKTDAPEKLGRVLDLGAKFEWPALWIFGGRTAVDIRDIGHKNFNMRKALHVGFEADWTMFSWWKGSYRVGLNQGYFTAGISALFSVFNLDIVTYGEDAGTAATPKENRVLMAKLNIDI